ncbi:unnamed protein product [Rhizophagus irregularis]|nr:unnamed protein product [Rhizophagus irregularis]CAB5393595.1 unnamed protein product [Rhizophagus irregularis]
MGFDVQLDNFNSNYLYQSTSKPNENCILYPYNFTIPDFPSNIHHFWLWVNANIPFNNVNNITINNNQLENNYPLNLDTNKVGLGIYVNLPNKYEEYKVYGFTDYLSDLGGFYSFIEGIFSFIFGSGKLEPWGKAQILFFLFGIPYIIKYSKDLVSSSGGIPLAEKVKVIYLKRMMISL